jgi:hypothetical protein
MDSDYIQHVRYKLQKRLKRLNTADSQSFHFALMQTWDFLQRSELTKGILDDLERRSIEQKSAADETVGGGAQVGTTEAENDGISYWVTKQCALAAGNDLEIEIGDRLIRSGKHDDAVEAFRLTYVEPLFDYIDEQLDDRRMALALLRKYKHRCEWFRRDALRDACNADTRQGEKTLAYDLYEYLHDQGIQFHIEPQSDSGRVDLISAQSGKDRLVADVKVFDPERGLDRAYIIKGFRQVYDYTKGFTEPFGYLIIFKTCEADLSISTQQQESCVPFITHNNKTIFLMIIDIGDYALSASKRGKLKAHEIMVAQFVEALV